MIFDSLRRLFSRSTSHRRSKRREAFAPAESAVERLEERALLTPFYDLEVVARTGGVNEFQGFGDLVTINNVAHPGDRFTTPTGTVAFVAFTDEDSNGIRESGLWTVDSMYHLANINPGYSDTNGRDFGRAVDLNDAGVLIARDRFSADQVQFFVRTWDSETPDEHTNIGSANSAQQPDFGQFSGLQTFTDINDRGDIVYIGQSLDASFRSLNIKRVGAESQPFFTFPVNETVPRPQLTADGRVLYRATSSYLALLDLGTGVAEDVAPGFTNIGYASGISKDGRLISFIGDKGDGLGVYLSYKTADGYSTIRIAGAGKDGWTEFDLTDAVRVNNTLLTERGVTVAYEAVHGTLGRGLYTTRVSFIDAEGPVSWDADYATPYVHGAVPVARVGDVVGGQAITDIEFWNGLNDRNRGELAFWVQTGDAERIVRAEPMQVVVVDFSPLDKPASSFTPANAALLANFGLTNDVGWDADFATAMESLGHSEITSGVVRDKIVDQIEAYFQDVNARVSVIGRTSDVRPKYVPWTTSVGSTVRGAYQTILVGAKEATTETDKGEYGLAAPLYQGQGGLDFFNQINDDFAVVFVDRIINPNGAFTNPAAAPEAKIVQAIASIIAHEAGHNFGLYHLESDIESTENEIMRTVTMRDSDLSTVARFSNQLFPREDYIADDEFFTPGLENSVARLLFGVGAFSDGPPTRVPADALALNANADSLRANLPYNPSGQGPATGRMLLGVINTRSGDILPEFQDLGQGNITQLLAAARLSIVPGTQLILLGSTDGTRMDIVGVPNGAGFDLTEFEATYLGITADGRLQATIDPNGVGNGFQLYHIPQAGAPVLMGAVSIQNVPELGVLVNGAAVDGGSSVGMGETTPGAGALTRIITIRNTGSGPLVLGTVTVTGAGYAVSQPAQSNLAPGEFTTAVVTLSDGIAGIGLQGQLTIPSNDPAGAFQLTLRGTIDDRPRILGTTRLDNGTGPIRVAIEFSGLLQSGPAGIPENFAIVADSGAALLVASAVYSETNGRGRIVLTTVRSAADLPSGSYEVRIDGTQILTQTGAPLTTTRVNLLSHQVWDLVSFVTIGADGSGDAALLSGPDSIGYSPPEVIVQGDFNYDGISDFVATSKYTGELVFHWGQADGGYQIQPLMIDRLTPETPAAPESILTADWNSDGFTDLVVFDDGDDAFLRGTPRLLVYLNDGQGHFTLAPDMPIPLASDVEGPLLAVGDFTGDGLLDIALGGPAVDGSRVNYTAKGSIVIYGKDPFVGYSQVALISTEHAEWYPYSAVSADLNADGRPDLVVKVTGFYIAEHRPQVYLSTPTGLVLQPDLEYFGKNGDIGVADFTGDGKLDIAIVSDLYNRNSAPTDGVVISLLAGNGQGQFTAQPNIEIGRRGVSLLATGDINQDGFVDLVFQADPFSGEGFDTTPERSLWIAYGRGSGDFDLSTALIPIGLAAITNPGNYILADVTGDGYPDLVSGNTAQGRFGMFVNDGAGRLVPSESGPNTPSSTGFDGNPSEPGIVIADLNRDGFPDQLRIISNPGLPLLETIDVLWGNAAGQFTIVSSIDLPTSPRSPNGMSLGSPGYLRVGDVNNDGWLDVLLGGSGGAFETHLGVDGKNFVSAPTFLVDAGPGSDIRTGELADLNGDGNLDIISALFNSSGVYGFGVFFGNGTGAFSYSLNTFQAVPGLVTQVPLIADFNGDNKLDLAFSIETGDGSPDALQLRIYQGLGNGKFSLGQTIVRDHSTSAGQLYLNDINGDGVLDILDPSTFGSIHIYLGSVQGQFTAAPDLTIDIGYQVAQLAIGDFTGDGLDDIAVTQNDNRISALRTSVAVYRGIGGGHFAEPQLIETGGVDPHNLALIPIAGIIRAGSFEISQPVLSVPPGAINISVTTSVEKPVAVNPRPLLASYTNDPFALAVSVAPSHGTVTTQNMGTPGDLSDDTFVYIPADGYRGSDSFTYQAADGRGSVVTGVVTITVSPKNQNPMLQVATTVLNSYELFEELQLAPNAALNDADSANFQGGKLTIQITQGFEVDFDLLELNTTGDGPGQIRTEFNFANEVYYAGQLIGKYTYEYDQPMVFSFTTAAATPAAIQAVLRHLSYRNFNSERLGSTQKTVTFTVTDGDGGSATTTRTIALHPEGSILAPVITTSSGSPVYSENGPAVTIDDGVMVSDADSPNFAGGTLTVDFPELSLPSDRLAIRTAGTGVGQINLGGTTVRYGSISIGTYSGGFTNSSPLVIALNSNATPAITQAVLRQITFSSIDPELILENRFIRFVINDGAGGVSAPALRTVTIAELGVSPEIVLSAGTTEYNGNQTPVLIDDSATVSDDDSSDFAGGSLTIAFVSGHSTSDRLGIKSSGTGAGQINLSGNSIRRGVTPIGTYSGGFTSNSALVISLNSAATSEAVTILLRHITFHVASDSPSSTNRVIQFILNDGDGGASVPVTKTVAMAESAGSDTPAIQLPGPTATYNKLGSAVSIDSQAVVQAPGPGLGTLGSGVLTISINDVNTGKKKYDLFNVAGLSSVGVSRGTQLINGRLVTVIDLNANATAQSIQNALRSVTFQTSKKGLKFTTRNIQISLSDSEGDSSSVVTKTINVSKKRIKVPR